MQTSYVGDRTAQYGDLKPAVLLGVNPPSSYDPATGDPVENPASGDYIAAPFAALTLDGDYAVQFQPLSTGDIRAGAPAPNLSGWVALWFYSGKQGITGVSQNAAGSGMTIGNIGTITFTDTDGEGATGTFTVVTATTGIIEITNSGSGYSSDTTATITGTGGTPPTLHDITIAPASGAVAADTDLSAESLQFGAFVTEL